MQVTAQDTNFTASRSLLGMGQIAGGNQLDAMCRTLERIDHDAAQNHEGNQRQQQRQHKCASHKHQAKLRTLMRQLAELVRPLGADLNRFQKHLVIGRIQPTRLLVFMIDDRLEHAVFSVFQHRL